MNMLRTASKWLDNQRSRFLSEPIEYIHFAEEKRSFMITATRGRTMFRAETDYGVTIRIHSTDFLISSSDLPITPDKGDEIVCDGVRYEVLAPNNEPVWRWSGADNETLRVHTKVISEVENGN
jgi:PII-like signaling protein